MKTVGVSPKPVATALTALIVWVLVHYGVNVDADLEAAISALAGFAAGVVAPPGLVLEK